MFQHLPSDKALTVEVVDGEVVLRAVDGPLGVSLTPSAAAETAALLAEAASRAAAVRRPRPATWPPESRAW
jgi:hypothetical protein